MCATAAARGRPLGEGVEEPETTPTQPTQPTQRSQPTQTTQQGPAQLAKQQSAREDGTLSLVLGLATAVQNTNTNVGSTGQQLPAAPGVGQGQGKGQGQGQSKGSQVYGGSWHDEEMHNMVKDLTELLHLEEGQCQWCVGCVPCTALLACALMPLFNNA